MLKEGIDYYYLPDGRMVLTAKYLLDRGFCCGKGCRHCPYKYQNVAEPQRSILIKDRAQREENSNT
jgi:hypothetical protein